MKINIFFTFLLAILFISCTQHNTASTLIPENKNVAIVRQLFSNFNKHEWENMAGLYTNPAEFKDPSLGIKMIKQTHQQTIAKYTAMGKMMPDLHDDSLQVYAAGDRQVIVEFISSATGPDGKKWQLPICTVFTIEKGKIIRDCTYYDNQH